MTREIMIQCLNSDIDTLNGLLNRGIPTEDKIKKEIEIKTEIVETLKAEPCDEQSVYMRAYREGYDKGYSDGDFFARHEDETKKACENEIEYKPITMEIAKKIYDDEPCEDAIDRRALRVQFNHLDEVYEGMSEEEEHEAYIYGQIIRAIDDAPPVTLKQRTGKWIKVDTNMYSCSNCSHCFTIVPEDNDISQFKWCPHCSAKMEGESE